VSEIGYSIDLDPSFWIPVPLEFPADMWRDARSWAHGTTERLMTGLEIPEGLAQELEDLALTIAESDSPLPEAEGRFWYFPVGGGVMHIAHLYATSRQSVDDLTLVEVAAGGRGEPEPQRAQRVTVDAFDEAWRVILLSVVPEEGYGEIPVGHMRFIGESKGIIVMLDVTGTDFAVLGAMETDLAELFASIRIGTDAELGGGLVGSSAH
jgi:hypothetical protein